MKERRRGKKLTKTREISKFTDAGKILVNSENIYIWGKMNKVE